MALWSFFNYDVYGEYKVRKIKFVIYVFTIYIYIYYLKINLKVYLNFVNKKPIYIIVNTGN